MGKSIFSGMFGRNEAGGGENAEEPQKDSFGNAEEVLSASETAPLAVRKDSFDDSKEALLKRIECLETKVGELSGRMEELDATVRQLLPDWHPAASQSAEASRQEGETAQTLYLSAPTPDSVFVDFSPKEQIGKSIYVLTSEDGLVGSFSVLDTRDAISTAIISLSQFLKPACKIANAIDTMPKRIVTVEPGRADFNGDAWVIRRKAVVRLEK